MGRKKKVPMDKLAQDMIQCKKDGYGVHYGAWRAAQYEKNQYKTIPAKHKGYKHTCLNCGKEFYSKTNSARKYCCDQCREQYYRNQKKTESQPKVSKPKASKPVAEIHKTCLICGKDFIAQSHRYKYCSEFCSKVGHGQSVRKYLKRRAEEAKANG